MKKLADGLKNKVEVYSLSAKPNLTLVQPGDGVGPGLELSNPIIPLKDVEKDAILFAIEHFNGNLSKTARALGIGRATLYRKLEQYNIKHVEEKIAA